MGGFLSCIPARSRDVNYQYDTEDDIEGVLDKLAIKEFYPNKINIKDVQKANVCMDTPDNVALLLLAKMLCLDFRARDGSFGRELERISGIHPQDLLLVLLRCCSPMLKQTLVSKLFTCNIAIPISVSDTAFVRPLYFIDITQKRMEEKIESRYLSNQNVRFVSFLRFGAIQVSKSEIINELIDRTTRHRTFFCKNSPNGSLRRCSSNGTVELSNLPTMTVEGQANAITLALNLRGDGRVNHKMVTTLIDISSTSVIFFDMKQGQQFYNSKLFAEIKNCKCPVILATIKSTNTSLHDSYNLDGLGNERLSQPNLRAIILPESTYDIASNTEKCIRQELKRQTTVQNNIASLCGCSDIQRLFSDSQLFNIDPINESMTLDPCRKLSDDNETNKLEEWYEIFSYMRVNMNKKLLLSEHNRYQKLKNAELFWIEKCLSECLLHNRFDESLLKKHFQGIHPNIFCKLQNVLLSGQYLQIMPDISRNKSVEFALHVLQSLKSGKEIRNDTTLLTIAIIGLGSTGKSTLLNSMFGVEFPVNPGGCTKGVCVHIVPTKYETFKQILIFDSEGLTESANPSKTDFVKIVMDLSDFVIINVKGENTSEKSYILQTLVHICVDLHKQNKYQTLQKTCMFAYQNMPEITTHNVFVPDKTRLSRALNNLSQKIACRQDCVFSDFIGFDIRSHVFYFPDFWCGGDSTSTVNVDYIACAKKVKRTILKESNSHPNALSTLETICNRLRRYIREETDL